MQASDWLVDTLYDTIGDEAERLLAGDNVSFDIAAELYDADETFLLDITDDVRPAGQVTHNNFRTIHSTVQMQVSRELQWGNQRIKLYWSIIDGDGEIRVPLGVYLLSTPETAAGETPKTWTVDGFDKLEVLAHPHGTTYRAAAGDAYLTLVEDLITAAGESAVLLDLTLSATVLPSDRVWPLDEQTTTLNIINDLLAAVGYRGLWVDQDGNYRSEPYVAASSRPTEWTYSADSADTMVGMGRTSSADFFDTPNRWVFVNDDPAQDFPVEGDGVYTVLNQSDGATSIDERGRTITRVVKLSAASQSALETQGDRMVERDKRIVTRVSLQVSPNPLHLHFDVVKLVDAELSVSGAFQVHEWSLPLDGSDMTLDVKAVG